MKRDASTVGTAEVVATSETNALASMVTTLEEDVILGILHPRERLVEEELMTRFGAKRHVVREALARLDQMGLVERRKNIGALVRSFTEREVGELYQLRSLLESEAARLIPFPVPPSQLKSLVAVQRTHDEAVASGDPRRLFRINQIFHQSLFAMAQNATLVQAIEEYARKTHSIRFMSLMAPEYVERARRDHWAIIEALKNADRKALIALCRAHHVPALEAFRRTSRLREREGSHSQIAG
jgi:DNA-binding GntR family transcriptional regulator